MLQFLQQKQVEIVHYQCNLLLNHLSFLKHPSYLIVSWFVKMIKDPFNKPTNNQIRRMFYQDKVELITDGTSQIDSYFLRYIKKPSDVSLAAYQANPANGNCELSEHTHREIVELAVSMALENIESRRYQTNLAEVVKQE
jgi:hypothetical protein